MKKFKFLGIAPYEGFKGYFQNSIKKHSDIDADIYSVSLDSAVDLVKSLDLNKYDAVISRGRTGKMIQSIINIPIVNVEFSGYDLLRALKQAQFSGKEHIAFVSFFDLVSHIRILSELLEFKNPVVTVAPPLNKKEMEIMIKQLYEDKNIELFIGDGNCVEIVDELGINAEAILVTSGEESMDKAIDEAIEIVNYKKEAENKNTFFYSLLEQSEIPITLFNKNKDLIFSNSFQSSEIAELHKTLKKYVTKVLNETEINTIEHTSSASWKIRGKCVNIDDKEPYALFTVKKTFAPTEKKGLKFDTVDAKTARDCVSLISTSIALKEKLDKIKAWSETKMPILIYGGAGTGKKTFALAAYSISKFSGNPLIVIDCGTLDAKALSLLFDNDRSPFYENDYTILFKKINLLCADLQNKLSYYISNTMLTSRNKIISTFTGDVETMISSNAFSKDLYHQLAGIPISMPSLNERAEDIPAICRSFLTNINQQLPVQIVGFEPEAMEIFKKYNWDYGITQLNFLLKQLVTIIKGQVVTVEDVKTLLSQSNFKPTFTGNAPTIDLSKTLEEISIDVINLVLAEEKNNQSRAAKRLGISRSTLWKKLNG